MNEQPLRVAILTSYDCSIASHHAAKLLSNHNQGKYELAGVILARPYSQKNLKFYNRKLRKILRIGLWGTWNGIQMRRWFGARVEEILDCKPLSEICSASKCSLIQTQGLNTDDTREALRQLNADVAVSLGNGFIAPSVFRIPKYGMMNIHHEILPDYQNAQSVIWQLYNNSTQTGYTIHEIERKIDAGRILHQKTLPITFCETLEETVTKTHAAQWEASANGLQEVLSNFTTMRDHGSAQSKGNHYTTPSRKQFRQIEKNWRTLRERSLTKKP